MRTLCLDFDGVCNSYTSGWEGIDVISDPPVDGLFEFLESARKEFEIHIFSSRSCDHRGIAAMKHWFLKHYNEWLIANNKMPDTWEKVIIIHWLKFPDKKPPAFVSLDDRALTFEGVFPDVHELKAFQPWHKRPTIPEPYPQDPEPEDS